MARTKPTVVLDRIVADVIDLRDGGGHDDVTTGVLDATAELLASYGLRRWSVDDVADRSGMGRTTIYRAFATRDDLVHAVLARELRDTLAAIDAGVRTLDTIEDKAVEGALIAHGMLRESLVPKLLQSDPATFLPFLTTGAGPLIALAREAIATGLRAAVPGIDRTRAAEVAEMAARFGLSFVLTPDTVFPVDDDAALRDALRGVLRPLLDRI